MASEAGSFSRRIHLCVSNLRLKGLLGPVSRAIKKKNGVWNLLWGYYPMKDGRSDFTQVKSTIRRYTE